MLHLKSASSNLVTFKVSSKNKKTLKLDPKLPYLDIYKENCQIFNQHPRICETINFHPKWKKINLGLKKLCLGLWPGMLKNYYHICDQRPPICLIGKFCATIRILKLGTKNALFGCFWQQFRKFIVIFATSALEFALLQSLVQKIKILKFGTKNARFPYFEAEIWKYYCHI